MRNLRQVNEKEGGIMYPDWIQFQFSRKYKLYIEIIYRPTQASTKLSITLKTVSQ